MEYRIHGLDHEYDIPSVSVASETVYDSSSQRKSSAPASTVGWGVIVNLKVSWASNAGLQLASAIKVKVKSTNPVVTSAALGVYTGSMTEVLALQS